MALLPALLIPAGCRKSEPNAARGLKRYESTREMMGTFVTVTLWAAGDDLAAKAGDAAFDQIKEIDRLMSDYDPDSELSQINREAFNRDVSISDKMLDVLKVAFTYSELSEGAFDVTVRPLKTLWKSAGKTGVVPDDATIDSVLASVGYKNVKLDVDNKTIRFLKPSMEIDLGGIAKGYSADLAAAELRKQGIATALVNVGGNIVAVGTPPGSPAWKIGVQDPNKRTDRLPEVLHLPAGSIATSGDYERFVEISGKRFSHIVDPRTGQPIENMSSVTVVAPNGITSDVLSTTMSVMGAEQGLPLAARLAGVEVMFVVASANGPTIIKSEGFDKFLK